MSKSAQTDTSWKSTLSRPRLRSVRMSVRLRAMPSNRMKLSRFPVKLMIASAACGGHIAIELQLDLFGAQPEPGMRADHLEARAPGDDAVLVGIHFAGLEHGREALANRSRG